MARKVDPAWVESCREELRAAFAAGNVRPLVTTDYSRSVRRCKLFVPVTRHGELMVWSATATLATAAGLAVNDRGIGYGGGGYSASLELICSLARVLGCDYQSIRYDDVTVG